MTYKLKRHKDFRTEWEALPLAIREQLKKKLAKVLLNPHVVKHRLDSELSGLYKIKLRKAGVRLIYRVKDHELIVFLLVVGKREDNVVYRIAKERLSDEHN